MTTAVVVGGASGIGAATVERHRAAGHDVIVWDLGDADVVCDISDPDQVDAAAGATLERVGAPDMVVAVAAREWAPSLRVNAVAPGVTDTPMLGPVPRDRGWLRTVADRTALGRLGTPDDIAEAILAMHGMNWVTGQTVSCDGGLSRHSPIDPLGTP